MELVKVEGVSKKIGANRVLEQIQFTQHRFQKVALAGETGSGKSTLLKMLAGLEQPDEGEIFFEGIKVRGPADQLVPGHPDIAYLSQHFELPKSLRVTQVLSYANALESGAAQRLYEVCRVEHLLERKTDQLSGGERQRIALARLLSTSPKLLLLDEPYSNLDMVHKAGLKEVIRDISAKLHLTCLLVSHEPADTLSWADEIIVMRGGKILQQATPPEIYSHPVDEYTASLFGRYCLIGTGLRDFLFPNARPELLGRRFFRPEDFEVTVAGTGLPGLVEKTYFFGSHYEHEIRVMEEIIIARSDIDHQPGEMVGVGLQ